MEGMKPRVFLKGGCNSVCCDVAQLCMYVICSCRHAKQQTNHCVQMVTPYVWSVGATVKHGQQRGSESHRQLV